MHRPQCREYIGISASSNSLQHGRPGRQASMGNRHCCLTRCRWHPPSPFGPLPPRLPHLSSIATTKPLGASVRTAICLMPGASIQAVMIFPVWGGEGVHLPHARCLHAGIDDLPCCSSCGWGGGCDKGEGDRQASTLASMISLLQKVRPTHDRQRRDEKLLLDLLPPASSFPAASTSHPSSMRNCSSICSLPSAPSPSHPAPLIPRHCALVLTHPCCRHMRPPRCPSGARHAGRHHWRRRGG